MDWIWIWIGQLVCTGVVNGVASLSRLKTPPPSEHSAVIVPPSLVSHGSDLLLVYKPETCLFPLGASLA